MVHLTTLTFIEFKDAQAMATLISLIPDPDMLLEMEPEELASIVLRLAYEHKQNRLIHPQRLLQQIHGNPGTQDGYPQGKKPAVELAFSEAWNWLTVQGILIAEPGSNGDNGYMLFGRRAAKLLDGKAFKDFVRSVAFPRAFLHPSIAESVWLDLARGDLDTAVFKAFRAVEIAVRKAGKFQATDIGVDLMRKAFKPTNGPLTDLQIPLAEQEALANLFAGAIGSYKNPHSHRTVTIDDQSEAQEMVVLASHLLRIVDSRCCTGQERG
jgi:uncharacterized protein (TIGR02391 family)